MDTYDHVRLEYVEDVGRLVMDRPDANNAMDARMAAELAAAARDLASDESVRCIVFTGTGGTFNTGADLSVLDGEPSDAGRLREIAGSLHATVIELVRADKPVVCGVNGVAAGGGVGPAVCGDVVVMADSARIEFAYPRIGLSADGGSTFFLPRLVGLRRAQELAFRDEPVGAEEAAAIGLATAAVPDAAFEDRLAEVAAELAAGPTRAYATTKALLRTSYDRSLEGQLAREAETLTALTSTGDYQRGIQAFFGDEPAEFRGQ